MITREIEVYSADLNDYVLVSKDFADQADYKLHLEGLCARKRMSEYGSWRDQLDEIYHDMEAWRTRIASVKIKYPKPKPE